MDYFINKSSIYQFYPVKPYYSTDSIGNNIVNICYSTNVKKEVADKLISFNKKCEQKA